MVARKWPSNRDRLPQPAADPHLGGTEPRRQVRPGAVAPSRPAATDSEVR
jgi:hypothetical protein